MVLTQAFDSHLPVKPGPESRPCKEVALREVKNLEERRCFEPINRRATVARDGTVLQAAEDFVGELH